MADRKKLIEVALPLDAINDAAAYDKLPGIGPHPKGIHKWWAPLPLPCARAVIFASLVDDPSSDPRFRDRPRAEQDAEREKLFQLMRQFLDKDGVTNSDVMNSTRAAMLQSCDDDLPSLLDPFCGSGAIPLEGKRLGLHALASDLNPIAVLMTKALVEIPGRFSGSRPVHPSEKGALPVGERGSLTGIADDLRYYGRVIWEALVKELVELYPKVALPTIEGGGNARALAWIWARTVKCPNPACGTEMPLISTMVLAKRSKRAVWLVPVVDSSTRAISFEVAEGDLRRAPPPPKMGRGAKFRCLACENVAPDQHIKEEGKAGRMGRRLIAVVAEGSRRRIYLPAGPATEETDAEPEWAPDFPLAEDPRNIWCVKYGIESHRDLYTSRQLIGLSTLTKLVAEIKPIVERDARARSFDDEGVSLVDGGSGARAYAESIVTYLALAVDRCVDFNNTGCRWVPSNEKVMNLFSRQSIPMVWDYAEANLIAESVGSWKTCLDYVADCLDVVVHIHGESGNVSQADAARLDLGSQQLLVSTDPPYYDNIAYSDLSDLFYVWLRRTLEDVFPDLLSTLVTPKEPELVAAPNRFQGSRPAARAHFESGFLSAFTRLRNLLDPRFPMTVYYAFKQSEESGNGSRDRENAESSVTGWETMLSALLGAGFQVTATWPVRASQKWRMISMGTNALASYIVLACRPRPIDAPQASRAEFLSTLRDELPGALRRLQLGNIAPVDLAQAAIGPGMAVFSRYSRVIEASGKSMAVGSALTLINQALDEVLSEQESEFDAGTRWAIAWYEQYGLKDGPFGAAETLAVAKAVAIGGLQESGMLVARGGKVRLLARDELADGWDPREDQRITDWEVAHHLVKRLLSAGESGAGELIRLLGAQAERARDLAYRLFVIAERKGWPNDAQGYNSLVVSWEEIQRLAGQRPLEVLF